MKKILALLLALTLILSFAACSRKEENALPDAAAPEETGEQPSAGLGNPMTEYDSLDDVNEEIGCNLMTPAVMGVSDQRYFVINCVDYKIGEVQFNVAGAAYCLRAARIETDISGYYMDGDTAFAGSDSKDLTFVEDGDAKLARWFDGAMQYVLMTDNGTDAFTDIAKEMQGMTADLSAAPAEEAEPAETPESTAAPASEPTEAPAQESSDDLSGEYADSVTQRAMMKAERSGDGYQITVSWASSAAQRTVWTMNTSAPVQGRLNYSNGTQSEITTNADASEETEITASDQQGWFEVDPREGRIAWSGAPDEQCRQCIFEKIN